MCWWVMSKNWGEFWYIFTFVHLSVLTRTQFSRALHFLLPAAFVWSAKWWLAVSSLTPLAPESERSLPEWDGEPVYVVRRAGMRIPGCADTSLLRPRWHCIVPNMHQRAHIHLTRIQKYPLDKNTKLRVRQKYENTTSQVRNSHSRIAAF